ncbi:MAG: hypothetical protein J6P94_01640 [Oscillospiraceae bacterium]|nr:hypothetical protein [Oscillospiraceae bacterium]
MYIESIVSISETEEKARKMKAEAALSAKKRVADARAKGEAMVAEAAAKAEGVVADMGKAAEEHSIAEAKELAGSGETKKAVMRARAEKRMDEAVALIVERIVKG